MALLSSWGRYPDRPQHPHTLYWPDQISPLLQQLHAHTTTLAFGYGRSYGDVCLAASDHVLTTSAMDRVLSVDWTRGIIRAQAGLSLAALLNIVIPHGWFPSVTPGTQWITLGGAVANDVHGKNHHVQGTFGCHVRGLTLYRSDEGFIECSPNLRPELFQATIGGLGLTGIILDVEIQLQAITSDQITQTAIRFATLDDFFDLSAYYSTSHDYTVAWIDCLVRGRDLGRGVFFAGNHADGHDQEHEYTQPSSRHMRIPFTPPLSLVNSVSLRLFNALYYQRHVRPDTCKMHYQPFFYPLDAISHWNRLYGRAGFQQYQCIIPAQHARIVIRAILQTIANSKLGSFLAVLKTFGDMPSPGLLSFPMHGTTLALDFPQGSLTEQLFRRLDIMVHEAGGRLYPAKDAHMSSTHFQQAYPAWTTLEALRDPVLLSHFWQRVTA